MREKMWAYCNNCEDLVEYELHDEVVSDVYKGKKVKYQFTVARCKECGEEVPADKDYIYKKTEECIKAYKMSVGIISTDEISEIMEKYDIGKEALADIAGFGKVTIKRYFDGVIPSKSHSDILYGFLNDEKVFMDAVNVNKEKLKEVTLKKIRGRYSTLKKISESKLEQIVNYTIVSMEEITPLALEKILFFSNGVNYAINGKRLIDENSEAWQHGPVYPSIYTKYKRYGYKPIDDGIKSVHGCMLTKVSLKERESIDLVISTFGLYSPKMLEKISHAQTPWKEKRVGYRDNQAGREVISELAVKKYYIENRLDSKEHIMGYIQEVVMPQMINNY
jgi:uncharacterized phage-associated protein